MRRADLVPRRLRPRLASGLSTLLSQVAQRFATDIAGSVAGQNILVLSPHPDDETLACGALLARAAAQHHDVRVIIVTDGRHGDSRCDPSSMAYLRMSEAQAAAKALGLAPDQLITLGYEDGTLASHEASLLEDLKDLLDRHQPQTVFVTSAWDPHPDHAALGRVTRQAVTGRSVLLYDYLIWGWVTPWTLGLYLWRDRPALRQLFRWIAVRSVRSYPFINAKRSALECYPSQLHDSARLLGLRPTGSGPVSQLSGGTLTKTILQYFLCPNEIFFPVHSPSAPWTPPGHTLLDLSAPDPDTS